jgi:hypothetical protein
LDYRGKAERTDLNTIATSGKEPSEGLTTVIADQLDVNPQLSARKFAQPLGIAASTVC